ncbi:MAG: 50S ribosomal protein L24 [Hyphomonadaceae bacterium]|jgi:large subunit ribosomal protein L24|nr:50S ribosomal protein L24 [Hyphomonadaceae bacterium]
MAARIKKGDKVIVLTGKDKGRKGEVIKSFPEANRVLVSGINIAARHTKPSQGDPQGGIKRKEAPIHVSNVAHVDPTSGKATRIGFKMEGTGDKARKVRFAKRSGENIDV